MQPQPHVVATANTSAISWWNATACRIVNYFLKHKRLQPHPMLSFHIFIMVFFFFFLKMLKLEPSSHFSKILSFESFVLFLSIQISFVYFFSFSYISLLNSHIFFWIVSIIYSLNIYLFFLHFLSFNIWICVSFCNIWTCLVDFNDYTVYFSFEGSKFV